MKLIIAGSRTINNPYDFNRVIDRFKLQYDFNIEEVVSGTAQGPDKLGETWAKDLGIPVKQFPAYWNTHGKRAGFIRNTEMANYSDAAIIIWDGKSNGSLHMAQEMIRLKKILFFYTLPLTKLV